MPRSEACSKKSREKAREASPSPEEPTPALAGNYFAALAPTDQGGPAEDDEEQPDAADNAGALSTTPESSGEAVEEGSCLAEDILAAPSALPVTILSASRRPLTSGSACSTAPRRRRGSWIWCCLTGGSP